MSHFLNIKKGLDLKINGAIDPTNPVEKVTPGSVALFPDDFPGFLPKLQFGLKEGDKISCGTPLLYDKRDERIKITAPCAGTVAAIVRGERRHIDRIVIDCNADNVASTLPAITTGSAPDDIRNFLMQSGLWVMMRQRPFDIVPEPGIEPRDIVVTGFDSAPLAADTDIDIKDATLGVGLLQRLTAGNVYISRRNGQMADIDGAVMVDVSGPHPSGNASTIISGIAPINKGEALITLDLATLQRIGRTARTGQFQGSTTVAVTGPEVASPHMAETIIGAPISELVNLSTTDGSHHRRIISGNVLTGIAVASDSYLHFPWRQLTVIAEGDDVDEFMGWASLSPKKMSRSRSFVSGLFGQIARKCYSPDARLLGGRRALIMSEEYDRYMPLDIYPEYLLKAIISRDIEKMEQLGIYEVSPEDFALGEWADTSKTEAQLIVRQGLDYLRRELQ